MRSRSNKQTTHPSLPLWLRAGVRPLIAMSLFLGALLFCALPSSVATNSPTWEPVAALPAEPAIQDMEITLRARKAIADDPMLAKLELGIEVRNRVATLWGSVSSKALAQQAEAKLRNGLGLAEVRNELHVDANEIQAERLPPLQVRAPLADEMTREPPRRRQSIAQRPKDGGAVTSQEVLWRPATMRTLAKNPDDDAQSKNPPPSAQPVRSSTNGKRPMPLVSLPGYPTHDAPASSLATPARQAESKASDLAKELEVIRTGDPRFDGITPELRGHVVYLRGRVLRWEHLYALAKSVANVRGVERVVLEDVHADSNE